MVNFNDHCVVMRTETGRFRTDKPNLVSDCVARYVTPPPETTYSERDLAALNDLRRSLLDYPCCEEDERMNEEIMQAPLYKLVPAILTEARKLRENDSPKES